MNLFWIIFGLLFTATSGFFDRNYRRRANYYALKKCTKPYLANGYSFQGYLGNIQFYCNNGYILIGSASSRCSFGQWNPPAPKCVGRFAGLTTISSRQQCVEPILANGNTSLSFSRRFVRYSCQQRFTLIGQERSFCVSGEWSPPVPRCVGVQDNDVKTTPKFQRLSRASTMSWIRPSASNMPSIVMTMTWTSTARSAITSNEDDSALGSLHSTSVSRRDVTSFTLMSREDTSSVRSGSGRDVMTDEGCVGCHDSTASTDIIGSSTDETTGTDVIGIVGLDVTESGTDTDVTDNSVGITDSDATDSVARITDIDIFTTAITISDTGVTNSEIIRTDKSGASYTDIVRTIVTDSGARGTDIKGFNVPERDAKSTDNDDVTDSATKSIYADIVSTTVTDSGFRNKDNIIENSEITKSGISSTYTDITNTDVTESSIKTPKNDIVSAVITDTSSPDVDTVDSDSNNPEKSIIHTDNDITKSSDATSTKITETSTELNEISEEKNFDNIISQDYSRHAESGSADKRMNFNEDKDGVGYDKTDDNVTGVISPSTADPQRKAAESKRLSSPSFTRSSKEAIRGGSALVGYVQGETSGTKIQLPLIVGVVFAVVIGGIVIGILTWRWAKHRRMKQQEVEDEQKIISAEYVMKPLNNEDSHFV